MEGLGSFLTDLFHIWWPLMSCAAFTILSLIAAFRRDSNKIIIYGSLFLAGVFIFVSSFFAWQEQWKNVGTETSKAETLQAKLDSLTKPKLILHIDEIGAGNLNIRNSRSTTKYDGGVFAVADLINKGAPSIADEWQLEVILNNGQHLDGMLVYMDEVPNVEFQDDRGRTVDFGIKDALYQKAIRPIQQGEKITGVIVFRVMGVDVSLMRQKGTQFVLKCKDIDGDAISARQVFRNDSGPHGSLGWFPGMNPFHQE